MEIPRINYKEWCGISRDVQEKLMEFLALLHFSWSCFCFIDNSGTEFHVTMIKNNVKTWVYKSTEEMEMTLFSKKALHNIEEDS